jgi:uncharacterized membrane protein
MRVFRWVLLITDVIVLLLLVFVLFYTPTIAGVVAGVVITAMFLANIIFIVITWRYERRGIGKITGVFD